MKYTIRFVGGHVEGYDDQGRFLLSADTQQEALHELRDMDVA